MKQPEDFEKAIAQNLVMVRQSRGLTQEQAAALIKVSYGQYRKWEGGKSTIKSGWVGHIAQVFSVSIDTLYGTDHTERLPDSVHVGLNRFYLSIQNKHLRWLAFNNVKAVASIARYFPTDAESEEANRA